MHKITTYCVSFYMDDSVQIPDFDLIRLPSFRGRYLKMISLDFMAACHAVSKGNYNLIYLHNVEVSFIIPLLKTRLPIISTAHGLVTLGDRWNGLLFEPGYAVQLAGQFHYLFNHPEDAVEMGKQGHEYVLTNNDTETHYRQVMQVSQSLLHSPLKT